MRLLFLAFICTMFAAYAHAAEFRVGFGSADITPDITKKNVFIAGFGHNRQADAILDPLSVRAVVLEHDGHAIAIATADVVGLFLPTVEKIRDRLKGFDFVLVSSTHNHHGPDTMGLWGRTPVSTGIDPAYLDQVVLQTVKAIESARATLKPAVVSIGNVNAPDLLHDSRKPFVLADEMVTLLFRDPATSTPIGAVVQWNCHPETLDSKNTRISSDFVGGTVNTLGKHLNAPVVYMSGAVGGMMTTMHLDVRSADGKIAKEGSREKMVRYGELLAQRVIGSLDNAVAIKLTPFEIRSKSLLLPVENPAYRLAKSLGVLDREMEPWAGDPNAARPAVLPKSIDRPGVRTEVSYLKLGEMHVAVIPGEIYPELVLGKVQDPADPAADFPDAPIEPAIYEPLPSKRRMIIGLGNDELGYILPKRQWDQKPPFCYGAASAPYGEINSLGPDTATLICGAFRELVKEKSRK